MPCTNVPVLCEEEAPCKGLSTVYFKYNIAAHFKSTHGGLGVTAAISAAMAKLTTAGPTVDISSEVLLIDSQAHAQAHGVVASIQKERGSVLAKFKSARARSAAAGALSTAMAEAAVAAEGAHHDAEGGAE